MIKKNKLNLNSAKLYKTVDKKKYYISEGNIIFLDPHPTDHELKNFYNIEYKQGAYLHYTENPLIKEFTALSRINLFKNIINKGLLLDVGCSSGGFIESALKNGYDAYGLEMSSEAKKKAKQCIKKRITLGDAEILTKKIREKFDVITAFDVVEHTKDPVNFIQNLSKLLKKNGILVFTTPDTDHYLRYLMGKYWPMLQPCQHLYLFNKNNFNKIIRNCNLEIIDTNTFNKSISIDYIFNQLSQTNKFIHKTYKLFSFLFPDKFKNKIFRVNIGEFYTVAKKI